MDLTPPNIQSEEDVKVYLERMHEYLKWIGNFQCQYMEWQEVDSPETPEDGRARIYAVAGGGGRTKLVALFPTGNAHLIVIEDQTTDDLDEGTSNLFYTDDRVTDAISDTDDLSEGDTNLYYTDTRVNAAIPDTDSLTEGTTNLYYTDERVDDRVDALVTDGDGITTTYDDGAGTLTVAVKQQTHEADASEAHTIADTTETVDRSDIEAKLNALGAKINAILVKLETAEILADS